MEINLNKIIEDILNRKFNLALQNFNLIIQKNSAYRESILDSFTQKTFAFMKSLLIQQRNLKNPQHTFSKDKLVTFLELHKSISRLEIGYCHIMNLFDIKKTRIYTSDNFPIRSNIERILDAHNIIKID